MSGSCHEAHDDEGTPPVTGLKLGVSIALGAKESLDRLVSVACEAEKRGVDAIWVLDSQLLYQDAYVVMAVILHETASIKVGPGITNLITRHPTVIANSIGTLATAAPGRVMLGVGTGDSSIKPLGLSPMRLAEFSETVTDIRALLRGSSVDYAGGAVSLSAVPAVTPRIYAAATQPRMLRTAGAAADGVILAGPATADFLLLQRSHIDAGAAEAGRAAPTTPVDAWVGVSVGDDEAVALNQLRSFASTQARMLADWKDLPPSLERFRSEFDQAAAGYDYSEHLRVRARHAHSVSDDFVHTMAIAGSKRACADKLLRLADLGFERFTATLLPGGREKNLEDLCEVWRLADL